MSDCRHKVTLRPWQHESTMVSLSCERCGEPVMVSLPSPPPDARDHRTREPPKKGGW